MDSASSSQGKKDPCSGCGFALLAYRASASTTTPGFRHWQTARVQEPRREGGSGPSHYDPNDSLKYFFAFLARDLGLSASRGLRAQGRNVSTNKHYHGSIHWKLRQPVG